MRIRMSILLCVVLAAGLVISGCSSVSDSVNQTSLEALKAKAALVNEYSYEYRRQLGSEEVTGRLYYKDENIRFEMFGANYDDATVTIVNQEQNKTFTFNEKMKKGAVQEPAMFLLDVPLPGEIMSVMNNDNCQFVRQGDHEGQRCTVFMADEVQLYGFKFSGEITISNESGLPVNLMGSRNGLPLIYEFKNLSLANVAPEQFTAPVGIEFK